MPFGTGGTGHTSGFGGHRRDDVRVERHARHPSAAGVKARQRAASALCHSPLARGTPRVSKRSAHIFHYINIFCSTLREKASLQTCAKGTSYPGIPLSSRCILVVTFENLTIGY